ncbi:MAG: ZIP family metal transporter [Clostridia bacterium]|nr:ZIP family metal transporter [Clostridia bacterium]
MDFMSELPPVIGGLFATLFTYAVTALGASLVFFFNKVNKTMIDSMLGFSAGVMIAASYWSLLSPAIDIAVRLGKNAALTVSVGFLFGGAFVMAADVLMSKAEKMKKTEKSAKRSVLLCAAVTLHNVPEGLAVGVAFGSLSSGEPGVSLTAAVMLAVGIGIQNFPEGACVSMPLYISGKSKWRSFMIGQASGAVEPAAGVLGALFASAASEALPAALSFSGGAMIAVVCSELIPEAFSGNKRAAEVGILSGFIVMMALDVALG